MPEALPRSAAGRVLLALIGIGFFSAFVALGIWQIERRAWKHALIERVDAGLRAAPVAAPGRDRWAQIGAEDAYRRVAVTGVFQYESEVRVQAVTEKGPGFWVLTPLLSDGGFIVLVNRGFVAAERRTAGAGVQRRSTGAVTVVGLLRVTEPFGGFLRRNDPAAGRWYSRDVAAIATARGLPAADVAPYFIDADAASSPGTDDQPLGGLTVVRFHDSHLVYAVTWFTMALMVLAAGAVVVRRERSPRRLR